MAHMDSSLHLLALSKTIRVVTTVPQWNEFHRKAVNAESMGEGVRTHRTSARQTPVTVVEILMMET